MSRELFICVILASQSLTAQVITTFAGADWILPRDPRPAVTVPITGGRDLAFDAAGNLYFADTGNHMVLRVDPAGELTIFAGNGIKGFSGEGGPATNASLTNPIDVAVGPDGSVYIAEFLGDRVRKVSPDGTISTFAGNGIAGASGDGGPATVARLNGPYGLAVDAQSNVYIADLYNHVIRRVDDQGQISRFAGRMGVAGFENGPALTGRLTFPEGIGIGSDGTLYIADGGNHAVRAVSPQGVLSTVAGTGQVGFSPDGTLATAANLNEPSDVTIGPQGVLYFTDFRNHRIRRIRADRTLETVAGNDQVGFRGDGLPARQTSLSGPSGIAFQSDGSLFFLDGGARRVRRIAEDGTVQTAAGSGQNRPPFDNATPFTSYFVAPSGMAVDSDGSLIVADEFRPQIVRIARDGSSVNVVAGSGMFGFGGDNGPALEAELSNPFGVALDTQRNLYFTDIGCSCIRRVQRSTGVITKVSGVAGIRDYGGDNGPAQQARLNAPEAIAVDGQNNLYIADTRNHRVRRITPAGMISTIAGTGEPGFSPDGTLAAQARLYLPNGLFVESDGSLLITDFGNARVRRLGSDGRLTTVAGGGPLGSSIDGVPATQAFLHGAQDIARDAGGGLLVTERESHRVRRVNPSGVISRAVGTGERGFGGDGGLPADALLDNPAWVAADATGRVYINDRTNQRIRVVLPMQPRLNVSSNQINFEAISEAGETEEQELRLSSDFFGVPFTVQASVPAAANWIKVNSPGGFAPAVLRISADPSKLEPGNYSGTIAVRSVNGIPSFQTVRVNLTVAAKVTPVLVLEPLPLEVIATESDPPIEKSFNVFNRGSGRAEFRARVNGVNNPRWLKLSRDQGSVDATAPASLPITIDPEGLESGTYTADLIIESSSTGNPVAQPVTLTVQPRARGSMFFPQVSISLQRVIGGRLPSQPLVVVNNGQAELNWSASARTSSGNPWLAVSPSAGRLPAGQAVELTASTTADIPVGSYNGMIEISSPDAISSPSIVTVQYGVRQTVEQLDPLRVSQSGMVFNTAVGASPPGNRSFFVYNNTRNNVNVTISVEYPQGGNWLEVRPVGTITLSQAADREILVQPKSVASAAGLQKAIIKVASGNSVLEVTILNSVTGPAGQTATILKAVRNAECSAAELNPILTSLASGAIQPELGAAVPLEVQVVDNCGSASSTESVVATFSNGDAPIALTRQPDGRWSATWRLINAPSPSTQNIEVRVRASSEAGGLRGESRTRVRVSGALSRPAIIRVGSRATRKFYRPIAPGDVILIEGRMLGANTTGILNPPLPAEFQGTSVLFGGLPLPLLSVNEQHITTVVPFDVQAGTIQQLIVQRGGALSVPFQVPIAASRPAVLTLDEENRLPQVFLLRENSQVLSDSANPVRAGNLIRVLAAGLGVVDDPPNPGELPRPDRLSKVTGSIRVTIGGRTADVVSATLSASQVGEYWVDVKAPDDLPAADDTPLVLSVGRNEAAAVPIVTR
ncbi:MAG TPA: SMP-30/gluconolactonase/LRE family protein [Bryobacteraceae bacterium]|nr:SMP-30/gluconolactonase/LRE family protein [Bryobacteraceae bacterium]